MSHVNSLSRFAPHDVLLVTQVPCYIESMRTIRTPSQRDKFLTALSNCGNVTEAAEQTGISRNSLYMWKSQDPEFSDAWEHAYQLGISSLEDFAMKWARAGSEGLTKFLLSSLRPEKYGNRQTVDINQNVSVTVRRTPIADLKAELDALIEMAVAPKAVNVLTFTKPDEE